MIHNPDTQVANCCRAIVRYMHANGLQAGGKLPSQDEFRQLLGFSHNTVTPAMNLLVESGMIERRRGSGTIVVDPLAEPEGLWRIALALGVLDNSPWARFETVLGRYVHETSQRKGCRTRSYFLNYDKMGILPHALADFGLLEPDLESGRIDAIVSSAYFSAEAYHRAGEFNIPLCNLGGWEQIPLRVELDKEDFLHQAAEVLRKEACRNVAIIAEKSIGWSYVDGLEPTLTAEGINVTILPGNLETDAPVILNTLLKIDPDKRPDGLIIGNDMLALTLTSLLTKENYEPTIVVQANKQIPLVYPMRVVKIEFDVEELAATGVNLVLDGIRGIRKREEVTRIKGIRRTQDVFETAMPN